MAVTSRTPQPLSSLTGSLILIAAPQCRARRFGAWGGDLVWPRGLSTFVVLRTPGPITTEFCCVWDSGQSVAQQSAFGVMGPGVRQDDDEYVARFDLNNSQLRIPAT